MYKYIYFIYIWTSLEDSPMHPSSSSSQWLCGNMLVMDGQWQNLRIVSEPIGCPMSTKQGA